MPYPAASESHLHLGRFLPVALCYVNKVLGTVISVTRAGNDAIKCRTLLVECPKLLLPHNSAMVDMISDRRIVILRLRHLIGRQFSRHVYMEEHD
jgi:hypothetical protein